MNITDGFHKNIEIFYNSLLCLSMQNIFNAKTFFNILE